MDKQSYRVRNWAHYNESLVQRGSITFWFSENGIKQWGATDKTGKAGRPKKYSDKAIECGLTLKSLLGLTFRGTEGFIKSLIELLKLEVEVPDYTLLCKRQKDLVIHLSKRNRNREKINIVVDTTGIKVYGEGEWKVRQHGWVKHRLWRKLHLAINEDTQAIEAMTLTDLGKQDCEGLPILLEQIDAEIGSCKADGSYDRFSCYEEACQRDVELVTPPQRNAVTSSERKANRKKASQDAVNKRDSVIQKIREVGRANWKVQTRYHKRSLAETAVFRVKTLLGNRFKSKNFVNQQVEARIWCKIVNHMTTLGMPISQPVN